MANASEPRFIIEHDDETISYKERRLIRAIRSGDLTGEELFRRDDEASSALRPLHESRLFQHVHGVDAQGAERMVDINKVRGFSRHMTAFLAVVMGLTVMGVNTSWAAFWLIFLAINFGKIAPSFSRLYKERNDNGIQAVLGVMYGLGERSTPLPTPEPVQEQPTPTAPPQPTFRPAPPTPRRAAPEPPEPPLHLDLRAELGRFGPLLPTMDPAAQEAIEATRAALQDLFARRRELGLHLDGEDADGLLREAAELETELTDPSLDAQTREAFAQTLEAVQQRQGAIADARRADALLRARARAALHQLKSLRLSLVSTSQADDDTLQVGPLDKVVAALRSDMAGASELEEALAEARQNPVGQAARAARRKRQ
jgi:hypothetical protein